MLMFTPFASSGTPLAELNNGPLWPILLRTYVLAPFRLRSTLSRLAACGASLLTF